MFIRQHVKTMAVSLTFCFAVTILASITEGGKAIWKNDSFIDGVAGVADARRNADWVTFDVGSGNYHFALNK